MKLMIKLMVVLIVAALALPMWLRGPDGKPVMELSDWISVPADLQGVGARVGEKIKAVLGADDAATAPSPAASSPISTPAKSDFYRWQDENGVWHFSDSAPMHRGDLSAEALPDVNNSMQAVEIPAAKEPETGAPEAMGSTITPPLPEGVSKEAIEGMLQDSHERRMGEHL